MHAPESYIAPRRQRYRQQGWDGWRSWRLKRQQAWGLVPQHWSPDVRPWAEDPYHEWRAERMAVYAAQVAAMDRGVGRILDAIRKAGLEENTLVIFLSDNGAAPDRQLFALDHGVEKLVAISPIMRN